MILKCGWTDIHIFYIYLHYNLSPSDLTTYPHICAENRRQGSEALCNRQGSEPGTLSAPDPTPVNRCGVREVAFRSTVNSEQLADWSSNRKQVVTHNTDINT